MLLRRGLPRDRRRRRSSRASPPGTRAAALPDSGVELPSGFLDDVRPAGPRERLRVRAVQRPAARAGHGPGQRPDDRRRHRRPGRTRSPSSSTRETDDAEADRRAVPPHPQPAGDPGGDRRLPRGRSADRRRPPQARRGARASARPSSPSSARSSSASARRRSPPPRPRWPPTRRSSRPSSPQQEKEQAEKTAKLEADLKAYEATLRRQGRRVGEGASRPAVRWLPLEPKVAQGHRRRDADASEPDGSILGAGHEQNGSRSPSRPRPT